MRDKKHFLMYSKEELSKIYHQPIPHLLFRAAQVHREFHNPLEIKINALLSVKTGGCVEDCSYCPQSIHYPNAVEEHEMLDVTTVVQAAREAKEAGASRFCLGTAWREVQNNQDFENILQMVREVKKTGMEVCCTLGMVSEQQALRLKEAGLDAYNHNIDSGENFYQNIITTRVYQDRLNTLENLQLASIHICSGGIVGMGETAVDRIEMIHTLAALNPPPESLPINLLIPIEGTPLEKQKKNPLPFWDLLRTIALARIAVPTATVRLSAGRDSLSEEQQAFCFFAGANSIFSGEKLLTAKNADRNRDEVLLENLGMFSTASKS